MDNDENLKVFITELEINKEITAEKSIEICDRLIPWLNENLLPEVDLNRVLDKLDVILYAIFSIETLWQMHRPRLRDLLPPDPTAFFTRKLLSTKNAGQLLPLIVHHYFKKYYSESKLHEILAETAIPQKTDNDLVEKVFRFKDISVAIDRLVESCPFEDILQIFQGDSKKSLILQNEICNRISNPKFIESIFTTCSNDLEIFYKILLDHKFYNAINNYFLSILQDLKDFDEEEIGNLTINNFKEISFLIGAILHPNSPVRLGFYNSINQNYINSNLLRYLSRMQIIYDY